MLSMTHPAFSARLWVSAVIVLFSLFPTPVAAEVQFVDVTTAARITFHHENGAQGEKHPTETMGSGVAFLDYDGDGWLDLYFVNSAGPGALYHNTRDGTFEEMTEHAGVANSGYGMGCAAADYDNDGDTDLYITCYGPNILYRNSGDGTFIDVTPLAGVGNPGLSTGTAFADYDRDGDLDLYVANYIEYRPELNQPCIRAKKVRVYCGPEAFQPQPDVFYRNNSDGTFTDVTKAVGLLPSAAKELGVVFCDYDNNGDPDLYVAGDRTPNLLYRNDRGRFTEVGVSSGVAYNEEGKALAGMGVAAGDYDNDGLFDFFVTNYQWETNSLYRNVGNGFFVDVTFPTGLGVPSLAFLVWGATFFDYDNDGDRDLFVTNGHLDDNVELFDTVTYAQQSQLFRNDERGGSAQRADERVADRPGGGKRASPVDWRLGGMEAGSGSTRWVDGGERMFTDVTNVAGPGLALKQVSRGSAVGDYDNDGDLDIVVSNNNQPAVILRNDGERVADRSSESMVRVGGSPRQTDGDRNHWLAFRLVGAGTPGPATQPPKLVVTSTSKRHDSSPSFSNHDGIGARIKVTAGNLVQVDEVRSGSSYLSQNDLRVFFGLGMKSQADLVEIRWPSGVIQRLSSVEANQILTVYEPHESEE
ncbi:MAG: CRTAC1 family protein [Candidatus Latescibacteria bacterium]|nr:CRTAC1 family protein [Candidatus Latescibacterota bacterium]